jgi:hypothetical protein
MRHQPFRLAGAAASVAVALAVCGGTQAAAARTSAASPATAAARTSAASPATAAARTSAGSPAMAAAKPSGCVTFLTSGPRAPSRGVFPTVSAASRAFTLAGPGSSGPAAGRPGRLSEAWAGPTAAGTARTVARPTAAGTARTVARPTAAGTARTVAGPAGAGDTVTVIGTTIAGQPAGRSDQVFLFNASDSAKFDNPVQSVQGFTDGVARFTVPAGQYWALGEFIEQLPRQHSLAVYLDVLPQFPVGGNTTIHLTAKAATSPILAKVAQPAVTQQLTFQVVRFAATGPPVSLGWILGDGGPESPAPTVYVSPTSSSPTVGKLFTVTSVQLGTAVFPSDSRYVYDLAYQSAGTIGPQQHVVNQAALAMVHLRYYSAVKSDGVYGTFPGFPVNETCNLGGAIFWDAQFPTTQLVYLSASGLLSWQTQFIQNFQLGISGGQLGQPQAYLPGEQQTQDFGAYPLHPAPNVRLTNVPGVPPEQVSAGRAGNTLRLALTAFSDNVPGHIGQGTFPPVKTSARYEIDQNGTKIAGGTVPNFYGPFAAAAKLSPAPSTVRFTLNTAESATLNPLSTASHTVWTWRSAPAPDPRLPTGWTCLPGGAADGACAVQPMMTLRYGVIGLGLDGATAPGQQVVLVQVGHLQLARAAKITGATVSVSFDGGKTWHSARVTGSGGSYAAVFSAPPGAHVTLRTSASDAAGGSVTETISNAYQVGSSAAPVPSQPQPPRRSAVVRGHVEAPR